MVAYIYIYIYIFFFCPEELKKVRYKSQFGGYRNLRKLWEIIGTIRGVFANDLNLGDLFTF